MGLLDKLKNIFPQTAFKESEEHKRKAEEAFQATLYSLPLASIDRTGKYHRRNFAKADLAEFKCKNPTKTSLKNLSTFVAFDVETTGISLTGNEIVELSAIKFENFMPSSIYTTLIHPRKGIPPEATAVNHITEQMVENSPQFYEIIPSFDGFIGKSPLVAHNALFDVTHLYASGLDSMATKTVYDTCELSRKLCNNLPDHKLATVCANYGIYFNVAHRAAADTLACGMLFVQLLMQKFECQNSNQLFEKM